MMNLIYFIFNLIIGGIIFKIIDFDRKIKFFFKNKEVKENLWSTYRSLLICTLFIIIIKGFFINEKEFYNYYIYIFAGITLFIALYDIYKIYRNKYITKHIFLILSTGFIFYTFFTVNKVINKLPIWVYCIKEYILIPQRIEGLILFTIINSIIIGALICSIYQKRSLKEICITLNNNKKIKGFQTKEKKDYIEVYGHNSMTIIYKKDILKIKYTYNE